MASDNPQNVDVAVALIFDKRRRILWTWNDKWGAFCLPMTKIRKGKEVSESASRAAARAAGEAFGVPVDISPRWTEITDLAVSDRDCTVKHYNYEVFEAKSHPEFTDHIRILEPHVWLTHGQALSGRYHPISKPCLHIIRTLIEEYRLDGRIQHTSALIARRSAVGYDEFLLHWNPRWEAYSLPMKRRDPEQDGYVVAEDVARVELGLRPRKSIIIEPAKIPTFTMHWVAHNKDEPTYYIHALFDADVKEGADPTSGEKLVWATTGEILIGQVIARPEVPEGRISITAQQVLAELDYIPWHRTLLRHSIASLALIRRERKGKNEWLAQWNSNWNRYNFVGGHREDSETFRKCLVREIRQELSLHEGTEFKVAPERRAHIEFVAQSESAGVSTFYITELFEVELTSEPARNKVDAKEANRWLNDAEILAGKASTGEPVSLTMKTHLTELGELPRVVLVP